MKNNQRKDSKINKKKKKKKKKKKRERERDNNNMSLDATHKLAASSEHKNFAIQKHAKHEIDTAEGGKQQTQLPIQQ